MDTKTKIGVADNSTLTLGTFAFDSGQVSAFSYDVQTGGWLVAQRRAGGTRVWRFSAAGAIIRSSAGVPRVSDFDGWIISGLISRAGGGNFDYVGRSEGQWWLVGRFQNDVTNGQRNVFTQQNTATWPTLNYDDAAGAYMVAESLVSGDRVNIRRYRITATRGAAPSLVSTVNLPIGSGRNGSLTSILFGSFDFGSGRYAYTARGDYSTVWVTNTVGTNPDESFPTAVTGAMGLGYDGSNFWTLGDSGLIYKHTNWSWTDTNVKLFAGITYYDSNVGGTGTHETTLGRTTGITRRKRSGVLLTLPTVPDSGGADDPNRWRLYTALAPSVAPGRIGFHLQAEGVGPTPSTKATLLIETTNEAGVAPPAANGFPAANPGFIQSAATDSAGPLIKVSGDGGGRMGPFTWAAGDADTGWQTFTPGDGDTGFTGIANVNFAQYRKIGAFVVVRVSRNSSASVSLGADSDYPNFNITSSTTNTLPAAARPTNVVIGRARFADAPVSATLQTSGQIIMTGGAPTGTKAAATAFEANFFYLV